MSSNKSTYGYSKADYAKFKSFAWKMLLSFGLTYMFSIMAVRISIWL